MPSFRYYQHGSLAHTSTRVSSVSWCSRNMVEPNLRRQCQPRWFVRPSSHWCKRDMAVRAFYFSRINLGAANNLYVVRPPPIEVSTNDSLLVHVSNSLEKPATLHHHGMFFNSSSWMDGAIGVTEWWASYLYTSSSSPNSATSGIPPGGNFDYVVPVDTSGQWGTYWVHAHSHVGPSVLLLHHTTYALV